MTTVVEDLPPALLEAVDRFLLAPQTWVVPGTLGAWADADPTDVGRWSRPTQPAPLWAPDGEPWTEPALHRVSAKLVPLSSIDLDLLTCDWRHRLALLPREDWLRLGLCLSALPFCGHLQRTMDGHMRRALRQGLDERVIEALDREGAAAGMVRFMAGAGAWKDPQRLACGGVRAAMEQVCRWPDPIRRRTLLRFDLAQLSAPASVSGLDAHWLELSCRLMWPEHPWLWS